MLNWGYVYLWYTNTIPVKKKQVYLYTNSNSFKSCDDFTEFTKINLLVVLDQKSFTINIIRIHHMNTMVYVQNWQEIGKNLDISLRTKVIVWLRSAVIPRGMLLQWPKVSPKQNCLILFFISLKYHYCVRKGKSVISSLLVHYIIF